MTYILLIYKCLLSVFGLWGNAYENIQPVIG
ncbi:hypothetical protein FHR87_002027 [Azomonas macrocytogenes]|uniref:Uncharacterized protein n=1 Tax=Azomonas macrocytogenes TaxID=69962 RepID=A0A839T259_AZOMA|nr:hypothetical protein [Azomonas macrocytogenes]